MTLIRTLPKIFVIIIICIIAPNRALSQEKRPHDRLLEFFAGACLHNMPDIGRIKAGARALNWKPLEGDLAAMLAPADKNATWQGWAVNVGEDIFMVGISEAKMDGGNIVTCAVATREIDQNELVRALNKELKLKNIDDRIEAFQRNQAWQTEINEESMIVNLTTFFKEIMSPATLSVAIKQ